MNHGIHSEPRLYRITFELDIIAYSEEEALDEAQKEFLEQATVVESGDPVPEPTED